MKYRFERNRDIAIVATEKGRIQGFLWNEIFTFRGIPYAKAKRFHAPEPVEPWEGVMDASSYGYVCPLMTNDRPRGELYVPHRFWPMDEDCQNLNIWTPGIDREKRPVMVWLHGGGYYAGSAIEHIAYDGANMSRYGNVVVVSINHRLNILGYFDLSDFGPEYENSGNAGGDDIIAALKWIRENIAAFGGDPDNVTLFGQSGGGAKITTLLQSPAADGLYARGIIMSGVIGSRFSVSDAEGSGKELAEAVMQALNIESPKELEEVDYAAVARAYHRVSPSLRQEGKNVGCTPHPNRHYLGDPLKHGFRGETGQIPLMVGSVFGEFTSFAPMPWDRDAMAESEQISLIQRYWGEEITSELIPLFRQAYPERKIIDLARLDYIFRTPEKQYISLRSAMNRTTWSYLFNLDQPIDGGNTPWHCSDIPYAFHNIDLVEYPHADEEREETAHRVQEEIFQTVMAFARNGNPANEAIPDWKASEPDCERTLVIDDHTRVKENYDHALMDAVSGHAEELSRVTFGMAGDIQH